MAVADHIVDSISSTNNNNNSNNDGEFDDDLKRVSEVLESSKACVFSNPTFFLDKKKGRANLLCSEVIDSGEHHSGSVGEHVRRDFGIPCHWSLFNQTKLHRTHM